MKTNRYLIWLGLSTYVPLQTLNANRLRAPFLILANSYTFQRLTALHPSIFTHFNWRLISEVSGVFFFPCCCSMFKLGCVNLWLYCCSLAWASWKDKGGGGGGRKWRREKEREKGIGGRGVGGGGLLKEISKMYSYTDASVSTSIEINRAALKLILASNKRMVPGRLMEQS